MSGSDKTLQYGSISLPLNRNNKVSHRWSFFSWQVGDVTILVNNAAVVHGKSLLDSDDDALSKTQHINTLGQFWVSFVRLHYIKQ